MTSLATIGVGNMGAKLFSSMESRRRLRCPTSKAHLPLEGTLLLSDGGIDLRGNSSKVEKQDLSFKICMFIDLVHLFFFINMYPITP